MSGNHNPAVLAAAAASQLQTASQTNGTNGSHSFYQSRLCSDCWIYWKKFSSFKYSNAKQERLNQLKNQLHKCSVNGCGREFKLKQLLVKHCGVAHGYFAKANNPPGQNSPRPPAMRNRTSFYLLTTPMTQAARVCCTNSIKLKKLARKPFKLVDLAELNKEWSNKESQPRNIADLVKQSKAKTHAKRLLSKDLIQVISKNYIKLLRKKKRSDLKTSKKLTNGTNGHHNIDNHNQNSNTEDDENNNNNDDDEEDDNELVIDNNDENKGDEPEFLKYFENKCTTPCFTPDQYLYPKPSVEQMNKFYLNLMTQNRKRPHEPNVNGDINKLGQTNGNGGGNESVSDASPLSKRSLTIAGNVQLNNRSLQHQSGLNNKQQQAASSSATSNSNNNKPSVRMAQKSAKPIQSINLNNAPEEFYYSINNYLKSLRREIKVLSMRKLARKPYKVMSKYQNIYTKFAEIRAESLAKIEKTSDVKTTTTTNGGTKQVNGNSASANKKTNDLKSDDEIVDVEASDNSNELILNKHKINGDSTTKTITTTNNDEDQSMDEDTDSKNDIESKPVVVLD